MPNGRLDPDRVTPPSSTYTAYTEGDLFRVSVPSNWRELPGDNAVIFAPDGAYGSAGGQGVFTHGVQFAVTRHEAHDVRTATDELVAALARSNPSLSQPSRATTRVTIGGRQGLHTAHILKRTRTPLAEEERIAVFTVLLADGSLFYASGVAPQRAVRGL